MTPSSSPTTGGRGDFDVRDIARIAVFAALIVALGLPGSITVGGSGVPITLQSLGVMLAGAVLGARRGSLAVLVVIALVAVGLPVLAGGRGGLGVFAGPTVGFLIGWLPAAAVIGWLTYRLLPRLSLIWAILINVLGGIVVLYVCGILGLVIRTDLNPWQALVANAPFLPGDLAKAVLAAIVATAVHRAFPQLARSSA
ncbi:biotin transporter BioY [Millisia brevis]|uniref:biotin transporter BioY n=1 Tax=Millisia brevis TaxID=264148 RepID=UPI00082C6090|nr:biotin transporter BioY [Millisia brevis]